MSRDSFKPRDPNKVRAGLSPLLYETDAPLVPYEAPGPSPETRALQREQATRAARSRRRRENPNETSMAQEALDALSLAGMDIGDRDELLDDPRFAAAVSLISPTAMQRYNPAALGNAFTDALTLGNAAEIEALARHNMGEAPPSYDDALREAELRNAREYSRSPGSAVVGGISGLANMAAIPLRGAPGTGSILARGLRMVAPAVGVGAGVGAIGRGLAAEPGHRIAPAFEGAVEGGTVGGGAALLGAAAEGLRALPLRGAPYVASLFGRGAASGAEFGLGAVPGSSTDRSLEDYTHGAATGAAMGIPAELGAAGLAGIARLGARRFGQPRPLGEPVSNPDESVLLMNEEALDENAPLLEATETPLRTPQQIVEGVRARSPESPLGEAVGSLIEAPPEQDRLFSLMATGPGMRAAQRQGVAAFGSERALVDELQRIGLAREGTVYSRAAERARAIQAQREMMAELADANARIDAAGGTVDAGEIADAIDDVANRFLARAPENVDRISAANEARAYAARLRGAPSEEIDVLQELSPWDELEGSQGLIEPEPSYFATEVTRRDPRPLTAPEIRSRMSEEWNAGRSGRQSNIVTGAQTPQSRVAPMLYQAFRPFRERLAEQALTAEDLAARAANQRGLLAVNAIAPPELRLDVNANAQPANLRANLGRIAAMSEPGSWGEKVGSGLAAHLRENLIANYQHSLRASANELRRAAPGVSVFAEGVPQLVGPSVGGALQTTEAGRNAVRANVAEEEANAAPVDVSGAGDLRDLAGVPDPDADGEAAPVEPEDPNDDLRDLAGVPRRRNP